jgi:hypothetical protein
MQVTIELLNTHALNLLQDLEKMRIIRFIKNKQKEHTPQVEPKKQRRFGVMKGVVAYMSPDFNAPLEDFKDYM